MTNDFAHDRQAWMGLVARAQPADLAALMPDEPAFDWLRAPQVGTTMVRGRISATGAPFNLGEMTLTRCALRLTGGTEGHAYVQGRDKDHARRAALVDALMQTEQAAQVRASVLEPLAAAEDTRRRARAGRAAATRVEFFTLAREN